MCLAPAQDLDLRCARESLLASSETSHGLEPSHRRDMDAEEPVSWQYRALVSD